MKIELEKLEAAFERKLKHYLEQKNCKFANSESISFVAKVKFHHFTAVYTPFEKYLPFVQTASQSQSYEENFEPLTSEAILGFDILKYPDLSVATIDL